MVPHQAERLLNGREQLARPGDLVAVPLHLGDPRLLLSKARACLTHVPPRLLQLGFLVSREHHRDWMLS